MRRMRRTILRLVCHQQPLRTASFFLTHCPTSSGPLLPLILSSPLCSSLGSLQLGYLQSFTPTALIAPRVPSLQQARGVHTLLSHSNPRLQVHFNFHQPPVKPERWPQNVRSPLFASPFGTLVPLDTFSQVTGAAHRLELSATRRPRAA